LINVSVGKMHYQVQGIDTVIKNIPKLYRNAFIDGGECGWYEKKGVKNVDGSYLMWFESVLVICGIGWILPRFWDSRCALLIFWIIGGVIPTLPSIWVRPRRILCSIPGLYIIAAVFLILLISQFESEVKSVKHRNKAQMIRIFIVAICIILYSATAFATYYFYSNPPETVQYGKNRRLAEIVGKFAGSYYVYTTFPEHLNSNKIFIFSAKYLTAKNMIPPVTYILPSQKISSVVQSLKSGESGTVFIFPNDADGSKRSNEFKHIFPTSKSQMLRFDKEFLDHNSGQPFCHVYIVPK